MCMNTGTFVHSISDTNSNMNTYSKINMSKNRNELHTFKSCLNFTFGTVVKNCISGGGAGPLIMEENVDANTIMNMKKGKYKDYAI